MICVSRCKLNAFQANSTTPDPQHVGMDAPQSGRPTRRELHPPMRVVPPRATIATQVGWPRAPHRQQSQFRHCSSSPSLPSRGIDDAPSGGRGPTGRRDSHRRGRFFAVPTLLRLLRDSRGSNCTRPWRFASPPTFRRAQWPAHVQQLAPYCRCRRIRRCTSPDSLHVVARRCTSRCTSLHVIGECWLSTRASLPAVAVWRRARATTGTTTIHALCSTSAFNMRHIQQRDRDAPGEIAQLNFNAI